MEQPPICFVTMAQVSAVEGRENGAKCNVNSGKSLTIFLIWIVVEYISVFFTTRQSILAFLFCWALTNRKFSTTFSLSWNKAERLLYREIYLCIMHIQGSREKEIYLSWLNSFSFEKLIICLAALETKLIQANFLESMLMAQVRIVNLNV